VALLFEVYGDEWLVIPAMHYRWNYNLDFILEEFGKTLIPDASPEEQYAVGEKISVWEDASVLESMEDVETGELHVPHVWTAHDCGRALAPVLVEGQIEGSAYMGLAEAMMEDHSVNRFGLHARPSLLDYTIPTSVDTPEFHALIVESLDPEGPFGAKEDGDGPLHPTIPALANAIFDACGIWMTDLPFTPAKVLRALRRKNAENS
jgi:4-hydroxybenzoyl-CoA reductase subunit alpha